jgi:hypothetical protein
MLPVRYPKNVQQEIGRAQFTVSGRGGLPSSPNELLSPDMVQDDFGTPVILTLLPLNLLSLLYQFPEAIGRSAGMVVDDKGVVTLVASATHRYPSPSCTNSCFLSERLGQGNKG